MPTWKESFPKSKPFHCSAAWHLWKSGACLAIYNLIGAITLNGEREFFGSKENVAAYFGMNYEATRRVFKTLVKLGFLESLGAKKYRYILHDKWSETHGPCAKRELFPWQESANPFVGKIWGISGGKIRLVEWKVEQFYKHIGDEELFIKEFQKEMDAATVSREHGEWAGTKPKSVYMRVFNRLKESLAKATVEIPAYK